MDLSIGLTGLRVAQRALELIGTNIANAGTEGYHRQEADIRSLRMSGQDGFPIAGAHITDVKRVQDLLLDREIVAQKTQLSQTSQELMGLGTIEGMMTEPREGGLSESIQSFFNSLRELSAQPHSQAYRQQAIEVADALAGEMNRMSRFVSDLRDNTFLQAQTVVDQINSLTENVAELNQEISALKLSARNTNILEDQRDKMIADLSELADVRLEGQRREDGRITVSIGGIPVVQGSHSMKLEASHLDDGQIGLGPEGAGISRTSGFSGRIGGLMTLQNEFYSQVSDQLDTLAGAIITRINDYHVGGLGTHGSFALLTGTKVPTGEVSGWGSVTAGGKVHMRLIAPDGMVSYHEVTIDGTDTISDVVDKFDAIDATDTKFDAAVVSGALRLEARNGYKFDFLPPIITDTSGLTGGDKPSVTIDGIFDGSDDETFTLTVKGDGQVGVTEGLTLEVKNAAGQVVRNLDIGLGYPAGDMLNIANGVRIALSPGTLNDSEEITVNAISDSDTSGFLSAAGINTFFSGSGAGDIAVSDALKAAPTLLATARGRNLDDNTNVLGMSGIADENIADLGDETPTEYYQQLVTSIGQSTAIRKAKEASLEKILQQLSNQRDDLSGVDVNEEAAKLLVFERMYQGVARVMRTQDETVKMLMELL